MRMTMKRLNLGFSISSLGWEASSLKLSYSTRQNREPVLCMTGKSAPVGCAADVPIMTIISTLSYAIPIWTSVTGANSSAMK